MTERRRFSPNAHRYLDGEPHLVLDEAERAAADRLHEAVASYARHLRLPGDEVDEAVLAAVRERSTPSGRSFWRWLVRPATVRVRPAWAAAVAVLLAAAWWGIRAERASMPATPGPVAAAPETVYVRFELLAPGARSVGLAGSFNGWRAEGMPLLPSAEGSLWTATLALPVGEHQYLFVVDGTRWVPDPRAHAQVDDGFGGTNSVIVVGPKGVVRS